MGDGKSRSVFQCLQCGELHEVDMLYNSEDDIYIKMKCKNCKEKTLHLYCGNPEEKYMFYNVNLDYRHYQYNTK